MANVGQLIVEVEYATKSAMIRNIQLIMACVHSLRLTWVKIAPIIITAMHVALINVTICFCPNILGIITEIPLTSSNPAIVLIIPGLKSSAHVPPLAMIFSLF